MMELLVLDFKITMLNIFKKVKGETKNMTETIFKEIIMCNFSEVAKTFKPEIHTSSRTSTKNTR